MQTNNREDFFDSNAVEHFEEIKEEILSKLEELREDILVEHGFFINFEDIYLPTFNERIINFN